MASLDDITRVLERPPRRVIYEEARTAAVAALVTPSLDLVLIHRATYEGDPWSGHVSFPGGRMEDRDPSALHAAIRETWEEIGVRLDPAQALGELDPVPTISPLPPLLVRPFVFALEEEPAFDTNGEVVSVHTVGLARLLRGEGRGEMQRTWDGHTFTLPKVDFDGVRLWGLTLRMVDDLLHRLDGRGIGLERPRR